jgi:hypothetical protein
MPENRSLKVLCRAKPSTMAITPEVASRPWSGNPNTKPIMANAEQT